MWEKIKCYFVVMIFEVLGKVKFRERRKYYKKLWRVYFLIIKMCVRLEI